MTAPKSAPPRRILISATGTLVFLAGAFVLLPAIQELIAANKLENEDRRRAQTANQEMKNAANDLTWIVNDPQRDEKLSETYQLKARKENE
ncbi:MAG: hypothetical protein OTJ44_05940 [Planctomycetota bacterium]|nr:hypothetical protein [Planctomycetota bacterium]